MNGRKFYKDKFNGKLFGVCAGAADYFGINAFWIRIGFIVLLFVGAMPILLPAYFIVALVADAKPPSHYTDSLIRTFGETTDKPTPARRMEQIDE